MSDLIAVLAVFWPFLAAALAVAVIALAMEGRDEPHHPSMARGVLVGVAVTTLLVVALVGFYEIWTLP